MALVVHGLNLQPGKMAAIIAELTSVGIAALSVSQRGHGDNYPGSGHAGDHPAARLAAFKTVTAELWRLQLISARGE